NATRLPRSVPITYGPDGSPNGVAIVFSARPVTSPMSYRPLPPMMPISMLMWSTGRRNDPAPLISLVNVAGHDGRIVLEENQSALRCRLFCELALRVERVHRIEVAAHHPGIRRMH